MHIDKPKQELLNAEETKKSLEFFLSLPSASESPPCLSCNNHVASKCSPTCVDAQFSLSSHPKEFPIEHNAVPLVFGLMSTRVTQTCWSCEGHMDIDNNLTSLPTVSFYTSSSVYPQLLHKHLSRLIMDKILSYQWQVVLVDYAQTWGQTYSIVPNLNFVNSNVHLGTLQNDLKMIGKDLQIALKLIAREMIVELDHWIKTHKQ